MQQLKPVPKPRQDPEMDNFMYGRGPTLKFPRPKLRLPKLHRPHIHLPRILDADDARMLVRITIWSVLLVWAAVIVAVAAGLAVRIFLALI